MHKIRYADRPSSESTGPLVRALRGFILFGVWVLVSLAALAAWISLKT